MQNSIPRLKDRKREAIVVAAIAEFRLHGFAVTSVDKIALRADVSKRTLYNHFASKEILFAEILRAMWQSIERSTNLPYRPEQPLQEQLQCLVMKKMSSLADDNFIDLARVAITALIHSPGIVQKTVDRLTQKEAPLYTWILGAQKAGKLRPGDASLAAQQLMSLIKGVAFWPQVTMGQPKLSTRQQQKLGHAAVDLFLSHYAT
jgi:TetR/AcrR family transcriptional regulator, regulator of autoinduction and epiphytic fitness